MKEIRIALLGFGSASQALVRMLLEKSESSPDIDLVPCSCRYLRIPSVSSIETATKLIPWRVVCIITRRHGRVCVPLQAAGGPPEQTKDDAWELDVVKALQRIESGQVLDDSLVLKNNVCAHLQAGPLHKDINCKDANEQTQNLIKLLGSTQIANIVVEAIPSNPHSGEPAISFLTTALQSQLHVVSANKGPVAHSVLVPRADTTSVAFDGGEDENNKKVSSDKLERKEAYWTLRKLAYQNKVMYLHESAVMDGVPIFSLWKHTLSHAILLSLRGCLNSTTTLILTRMEGQLDKSGDACQGESFEDALAAAKQMGVVEEDESLDVDGYDAAVKLRALLVVLSSSSHSCSNVTIPSIENIPRDSIRSITQDRIRQAYLDGRKKYRLVASAELVDLPLPTNGQNSSQQPLGHDKSWNARVQLQLLTPDDPLYNLSGTSSSIQFCTNVLGPITVVSTDPTLVDTAYGLFSDIVRVASETQ